MNTHDEESAKALAERMFKEIETKRVFKEALTEWMDKKFQEFGRASMKAIAVVLFGALVVFVMWTQGYHR